MAGSMDMNQVINIIAVSGLPLLLAITVHEAAHAYVAHLMGDDTAKRAGRVTLNPVPHIDIVGTILLPMICIVVGGVLFGWAKPVPIDPSKMRYPRKSPFWVALAGPLSNFIMALLWALLGIAYNAGLFFGYFGSAPIMLANAGISVNLMLMIFNLLPLPPLDGARMLERFMNYNQRMWWARVENYGMMIVLVLGMTGILYNFWLSPLLGVFSWVKDLI